MDNACDVCGDAMIFTNDERFIVVIRGTETVGEDEEAVTTTTYTVYDVINATTLWSYSYDDSDDTKDYDVYISFDMDDDTLGFGFIASTTVETEIEIPAEVEGEDPTYEYEYQYNSALYTFAKDVLFEAEYTDEDDFEAPDFDFDEAEGGVYYVTINDTVYAIDEVSGKLIHSADENVFVKRPAFDKLVGNYGIVEASASEMGVTELYVYDLTKWLSCVFTYKIPSTAQMAMSFYLADGNLLVQYLEYLDPNARTYDIFMGGVKADITYVYVDIAAQTATEVDFGYFIRSCQNGEAMDILYKDHVQNVMQVAPIVDGAFDMENADTMLIVDNDLTIKFASDVRPLTAQEDPLFVVDDNRYITSFVYGADGVKTWAVVDENLEIVTYLPYAYAEMDGATPVPLNPHIYRDGFIVLDGKIYNYDMELILEMGAEDGYELYSDCVNFLILTKTFVTEDDPETLEDEYESVTKYYFFDPAETEAPTELTGDLYNVDMNLTFYVIKNTVAGEEGEPDTYTYDVYNNDGEKILAGLESAPTLSHSTGRSYITVTTDDAYYLIKTSILGY